MTMHHKDSKTKIVATIGPASENLIKLKALINHGVDIFRLNFKHNTIDWHADIIKRIRSLKPMYTKPGEFPAIMLDLQGPSIRLVLAHNSIVIKPNQPLTITNTPTTSQEIGFTYPNLGNFLQDGDKIYADDGKFSFTVKKQGSVTQLIPHEGGELLTKKSVNLPGIYNRLDIKPLTERDLQGLKLALLEQIELVAISFVRSIHDIVYVHEKIAEFKKALHLEHTPSPQIVSKIETIEAVENIEEITIASDAIMVARGDLAIEAGFYTIPYYQAKIVETANNYKRPVIIATQMLESMTKNYLPTRAEITDVGHAVENRADAIMFSGETAMGHHPTRVIEVAQKILYFTEKKFEEIEPIQVEIQDYTDHSSTNHSNHNALFPMSSQTNKAIRTLRKLDDFELAEYNLSTAAYHLYLKHSDTVTAFIVFTKTGKKATYLSKYKPSIPIIAFVPNSKTYGITKLAYNVFPVLLKNVDFRNVTEQNVLDAIKYLKQNTKLIKPGKHIISVYTKQLAPKINPRVLEIIPIQ